MSANDSAERERRRDDRFSIAPMYTEVMARRLVPELTAAMGGHAYDISVSGVRIELDEPLNLGECVSLDLHLPSTQTTVQAIGEVVWVNDELDDPGPRRMALRFTGFASSADQARLLRYLGTGQYRKAA